MIALQSAWGWQAALYLFLGGLGAGMFVAAALLGFVRRKRHRKTIALCFWLASVCLAVGLLLLLSELVHPARALLMGRSFSHLSSWMARGAWGVVAAFAVFLCTALLATKRTSRLLRRLWKAHPRLRRRLRTAFSVAGCVLALFVACYTGLLLMNAPGVPFWNSWLLPCLFTTSALGAGMNAAAIVAVATGSARKVARRKRWLVVAVVIGVTVVEAVVLLLYVGGMLQGDAGGYQAQQAAAAASARMLVSGSCAPLFWAFVVGGGLAVPLALSTASFFLQDVAGWRVIVASAACALVGECMLRFLILHVGMQAGYVAYVGQAIATMI